LVAVDAVTVLSACIITLIT